MLARINGGNGGVVDYLVNGIKNGRDFTRDELDHRLVLDGDLNITDQVINSIKDQGQDRYLHITLSFQEDEVSKDLLEKITQDYKHLLMSAHEEDEYNFYAEAHIPKIKYIEDQKTGEMIERKPHIHIVIPHKNLLTGQRLNSVGLVNNNIKELDAIQEHINLKYGLESPKNNLRVQGGDRARIISREKADVYKERNGEIKADIFTELEKRNIRDTSSFESLLAEYGEVRVYNKGKIDSYYGIRKSGDKKFIRLKSKVFTKEYIEKRSIAEPVKNVKQINKLVRNWREVTSKEIKYINPSSKPMRIAYATMDKENKANFINDVEGKYYERHKDSIGYLRRSGKTNRKSSITQYVRTNGLATTGSFQRLSQLRTGSLVHSIPRGGRGGRGRNQPKPILPRNESGSLAKTQHFRESQHSNSEMRHLSPSGHGRSVRRIGSSIDKPRRLNLTIQDPVVNRIDQEVREFEYRIEGEELKTINLIKKNIDPERFLSHCCIQYFLNPENHKISKGKDGSPRFSDKKRNWNALDFLTKSVNLDLDEAVEVLKDLNDKQNNNTPFVRVDTQSFLNKEDRLQRNKSLKSKNNILKKLYKEELKKTNSEIYEIVDSVFKNEDYSYEERRVLKDFYNALKWTKSADINKKYKDSVSELREDYFKYNPFNEKEHDMTFEKIKQRFKGENNEITGHSPCLTFDELLEKNRRQLSLDDMVSQKKIFSLEDLAVVKNMKNESVEFLDPESRNTLFVDKGESISYKGGENADATLAMLEYAHKKFGGQLKLTGSKEFKEACVQALAKSDMKVVLLPKKYHEMLVEQKKQLSPSIPVEPIKEKTAFEVQIDQLKKLDNDVKNANQDTLMEKAQIRDQYMADLALSLTKEEELRTGEPITTEMIDKNVKVVAKEMTKDFDQDMKDWNKGELEEAPDHNKYNIPSEDTLSTVAENVAEKAQKEQEKADIEQHRDIISTRTRTDLQSQGIEIEDVQLSKITNESIHKYSKLVEKDNFKVDRDKGTLKLGDKDYKFPKNLVTNKAIINHVAYDFVRDDINSQMENRGFAQPNKEVQDFERNNEIPSWITEMEGAEIDDEMDR